MQKQHTFLAVLWAAVILWMGLIFSFSAETAEASGETSESVLEQILRILDADFETYSAEESEAVLERYSRLIRKTAHFCIYTVLGFLISSALTFQNRIFRTLSQRNVFLFSLSAGSAYAVSDEIHQYFVPGRSCQISDMMLDSAGVLLGVSALFLFVFLLRKAGAKKSSAVS